MTVFSDAGHKGKRHRYEDVVLGFTESVTEETNKPEHFASKAGGRPVWLYRGDYTPPKMPQCGGCGQVEKFLCQVYAPIEQGLIGHDDAFHRVLYVTVCTSSACIRRSDGKGATVLRAQLPRENTFYDFSAAGQEDSDDDNDTGDWDDDDSGTTSKSRVDQDVKDECALCGFWGELICGGCRLVRYCSKRCQREDWKLGHSKVCRSSSSRTSQADDTIPSAERRLDADFVVDATGETFSLTESCMEEARKSWRLAELEIVTDRHVTPPSSDDEGSDEEDGDGEELNLNQEMEIRGSMQDASAEELPEDLFREAQMQRRRGEKEDAFERRFRKVVGLEPDQVIRYERGGEALWARGEQQCNGEDVGVCELCGGKRRFEMQVMAQMIYMVGRERRDVESGRQRMEEVAARLRNEMDWATIVIFSCERSCPIEVGQYTCEAAWVQRH